MTALADLRLDIRSTLLTPPPALDHVLPGLLAGTVGVLVAPGGAGKTMLLTQMGCAIACGQPILGGALTGSNSSPGKVVLFLAEETAVIMHHRLHGATQQLKEGMASQSRESLQALLEQLDSQLSVYPLGGHGSLVHFGDGTSGYRQLVELCMGARLVVVDPLRRFHDGDENDSAAMTAIVTQFQRVAYETGAAVLIAHHANRVSMTSGGGEQAYASRGSTALTDGVRWQANLSPVSESLARELGIEKSELRHFVRLDVPKTNYGRALGTVVLRKVPDSGAMELWVPETLSKRAPAARTELAGTSRVRR
ncbi:MULTISPECIES: helicase RepA family protein [Paraburkholderia]|uniref:AAA family ATPase n=1 Tax=Paraburkholderia podalyriae TaxID=1938811 RepID=A0ABR7PQK9_9BURK|nr:helicase RepA family protein [Paraburkholderia podalyriae]MBC8748556.1 AAA family ATPase [Paraburkholderia podalyriae]